MTVHLTKIVPELNQRRYYRLHVEQGLFGDWALVREYGRIGRAGQTRSDWFESKADAEQAETKLAAQKGRRGYA
jgi:predicted DNA-binding WGR domain protein